MSTHVRLKFRDKNKKCSGEKVAELAYGRFNVPFTRIFPTPDGFKAICRNESEADKLLTAEANKQFNSIGLSVFMPPEIKARRSLFARKVDHHIGKHTPTEILKEIEEKNYGVKLSEVIKIKDYTHVLKFVFADTAVAEKVLREGLRLFNLSVTPSQLEREKFVNVQTCFKCYKFNDHSTANCPNKDLVICSECAEQGHTYTQCTNPRKACINCKQRGYPHHHRTLAMSCPVKKEKIKQLERKEKDEQTRKQQAPYAAAAKAVIKESNTHPQQQSITLSDFTHFKVLTAVVHAHILNICNPGSYERELNEMLKANNLPPVKVPKVPDSTKLFSASGTRGLAQAMKETMSEETRNEQTRAEQPPKEQSRSKEVMNVPELEGAVGGNPVLGDLSLSESDTESYSSIVESSDEEQVRKRRKKSSVRPKVKHIVSDETGSGLESGITIYVNENDYVPTKDVSLQELVRGIDTGKYKWSHQEANWSDHTVYDCLKAGKIKVHTSSFKKLSQKEFNKTKNGKKVQKPPRHQPATKRTKSST